MLATYEIHPVASMRNLTVPGKTTFGLLARYLLDGQ